MPQCTDHRDSPKSYPALCQGESCYDEVLLEGLDQQIAGMTGQQGNKLVAFHLMGSHGPTYFRRYPASERAFMPDCPRSDIENCSNEELVNTYDNTIRYTDKVVGRLIDKLKSLESQYDVGLVYLSDHGESLGAMGLYLHGTPYKFAPDDQTRVPLLTWFSPSYRPIASWIWAVWRRRRAANASLTTTCFTPCWGSWMCRPVFTTTSWICSSRVGQAKSPTSTQ